MTYDLGLRCAICGSIITDDNPDGIGFGCRQNVVRPAEVAAAKELNPSLNLEEIFKEVRNILLENIKNGGFVLC